MSVILKLIRLSWSDWSGMSMKILKKNVISIVCIVSTLTFIIGVERLEAAGKLSDSLKSEGNIEYDSNGDGKAEVLFYSNDLSSIAGGIDNLNSNMGVLSNKYDELTEASIKHKAEIIKGLNSNVYAKANIDSSATYDDLIKKINNIPAPTIANGLYYANGDNSGLNAGLSSGKINGDINIDSITELKLGINEAIKLPSGYYPSDITIYNNILNRGSITFNPSSRTSLTLPAGYYSGGTLSSAGAYDAGYNRGLAEGTARSFSTNATVTYTVHHAHIDSCYSYPIYTGYTVVDVRPEHDSDLNIDRWSTTVRCNTCGACAERATHQGRGKDYSESRAVENLMKQHTTINGVTYCTSAGKVLTCGKAAGSFTTTNAPSLGAGDRIVSAVINY